MHKTFAFLIALFSIAQTSAQTDSVQYFIDEGIKKHDEGKYAAAIELYDNALRLDPKSYDANYEKSYSLYASRQYDQSISLSRKIIKEFRDNPQIKSVYTNWASALDDQGNADEALKIYDKGIEAFPDFHLLHYNKGLTLYKLNKNDEALRHFEKAVELKPFHASSNNAISLILLDRNKVPALLASVMFLITEKQGERAKAGLTRVENIFNSNTVRGENGNVTISINSALLDRKKGVENDFGMAELSMLLLSGLDKEDAFKNENQAERLQRKLNMVISSLSEHRKNKGFYWTHYVPFFTKIKEKGFTDIVAYISYYSVADEVVARWLKENDTKVKEFYKWLEDYNWSK